jgi:DNA polymerase III alpha subunit
LAEPTRLQRLQNEEELLGYPASGHPLELFPDIAWETYCPVNRLGDHVGAQIVTCGLVIEQRLFHQVTGEPMKFITIADWTGVVETELFARTYQSYAANTVRYRVLEITATVEPFENSRGFTLRVLRANKPRTRKRTASGRASVRASPRLCEAMGLARTLALPSSSLIGDRDRSTMPATYATDRRQIPPARSGQDHRDR